MGYKRTWKCTSCNYSKLTSGGTDAGFNGYTNTFVCQKCKRLVDLPVDFSKDQDAALNLSGEDNLPEFTSLQKGSSCNSCHSKKHLIVWDKKSCPKCNGIMEVKKGGMEILWD